MHWAEVEELQPRLGELARRRMLEPGVVLVVTLRRDGTARLSPVEPWFMDGELWLSMMEGSLKARDLLRDRRVLVHSVVSGRDGGPGEVKVRGSAALELDPDRQVRYAAEVAEHLGWRPEPGRFHLFRVDVAHLAFVRYDDATGDQFVAAWPPGREYARRATSATSVGAPEPGGGLLVGDEEQPSPSPHIGLSPG